MTVHRLFFTGDAMNLRMIMNTPLVMLTDVQIDVVHVSGPQPDRYTS